MAHGKHTYKMPPLFKKENARRTVQTQLVNNPKKLQALKEVVDQASKVNSHLKDFKNVYEWFCFVETLIPNFEQKTEFTEKLEALVNEYHNEPEDGLPTDIS